MEFKIAGTNVPVSNVYDNKGAHNQIKLMMQKGEKLSIKFFTTRDNYPCAWIESAGVAGFKYLLTEEGLTWLFSYLTQGSSEDFGVNPMEAQPYKEGVEDIQLSVVKQIVESSKIQWVPLFRERNTSFISGYKDYLKGKIHFRLPRTEELLDYLKEHNQTI